MTISINSQARIWRVVVYLKTADKKDIHFVSLNHTSEHDVPKSHSTIRGSHVWLVLSISRHVSLRWFTIRFESDKYDWIPQVELLKTVSISHIPFWYSLNRYGKSQLLVASKMSLPLLWCPSTEYSMCINLQMSCPFSCMLLIVFFSVMNKVTTTTT